MSHIGILWYASLRVSPACNFRLFYFGGWWMAQEGADFLELYNEPDSEFQGQPVSMPQLNLSMTQLTPQSHASL